MSTTYSNWPLLPNPMLRSIILAINFNVTHWIHLWLRSVIWNGVQFKSNPNNHKGETGNLTLAFYLSGDLTKASQVIEMLSLSHLPVSQTYHRFLGWMIFWPCRRISQVLSGGDSEKKMGIISTAPSSVFLSKPALLGHGLYAWLLYEYLKIRWLNN